MKVTRMLPPFDFFEGSMERRMSDLFYERKIRDKAWVQAGTHVRILISYTENILEEKQLDTSACRVSPSDGDTGVGYAKPLCQKALGAKMCLCPNLDQHKLPCKHFTSALQQERYIAQLCHSVYKVASYTQAYAPL
ncbi:hypothetical protein KXD40_002520 [Peronospora effusa]|uniref:SWIM-type domain-containing protein n=1 Tax=Peronospora effusa TaxID=542832 RepID=A0A3M6V7T5_9STRA|nr:hypothetical protein DD238_005189 [Peronospora effusa]RQM09978.1 hypothetical protein DD237_006051 [Peronospora effusa]UIZ26787.1 hypothetical protein KXD40_002520 [Peronospora effusa]CAI5703917.1 unnamed protein product [Peronospora effusa]